MSCRTRFHIISPSSVRMPKRRVHRLFVHCSAADNTGARFEGVALAKTIDSWHRLRRFECIGYHYVIDKKGQLITARNPERTPAAQRGHNTGTLAVCLHGLRKSMFTKAQFDTLRQFVAALIDDVHRRKLPEMTVHGHCEVAAKACPVFDYRRVLGLDKYGHPSRVHAAAESQAEVLNEVYPGSSSAKVKTPTVHEVRTMPVLRYGSRGLAVERLQRLLNIKVDGLFFGKTRRAVREFQMLHRLKVDGVVGPVTWRALLAARAPMHYRDGDR